MAEVRPVQAFEYSKEYAHSLGEVITAPYDVISPAMQQAYYERSPYNIIRLEFDRVLPEDTSINNRYTRAAATFAEWRLSGVLRYVQKPSMYVHKHIFTVNGTKRTRTSLFARVRLEPFESKVVLPHEFTMPKPKDDRLKLLHACSANLSPLMMLFEDQMNTVSNLILSMQSSENIERFTDEVGEDHELSQIDNPSTLEEIQNFFQDKPLFIADGHHRYETALAYRDERISGPGGLTPNDPANFVMVELISITDPGLVVLPTHRIIRNVPEDRLRNLEKQVHEYFTVDQLDPSQDIKAVSEHLTQQNVPAFVAAFSGKLLMLKLNEAGRRLMQHSGQSEEWQKIDTAVLQQVIMEPLLGISSSAVAGETHIEYTRDASYALKEVMDNRAQVTFLLNATLVDSIRDVSLKGERMPQKSTYFYPKCLAGMVINPLW